MTRPAITAITRHSTMGEVLEAYPSAQRALFQRYHVGGCNSCGYQPGDKLEEVARGHNMLDVDEVIAFLEDADQIDRRAQVSPGEVAAALGSDDPPRLIDVRPSAEWQLARIQGATLMTEALAEVMMRWPKDTPIVFYCHLGQRSLDAASYFAGHGFTDLRSMTGGIEAWSLQVDRSVPRYELAPDLLGGAAIRPLRSAVSQAEGCQSPMAS
jgi:rhodanese-related sulfurtransferase